MTFVIFQQRLVTVFWNFTQSSTIEIIDQANQNAELIRVPSEISKPYKLQYKSGTGQHSMYLHNDKPIHFLWWQLKN